MDKNVKIDEVIDISRHELNKIGEIMEFDNIDKIDESRK